MLSAGLLVSSLATFSVAVATDDETVVPLVDRGDASVVTDPEPVPETTLPETTLPETTLPETTVPIAQPDAPVNTDPLPDTTVPADAAPATTTSTAPATTTTVTTAPATTLPNDTTATSTTTTTATTTATTATTVAPATTVPTTTQPPTVNTDPPARFCVSGRVWLDVIADGVQADGEPGIADAIVGVQLAGNATQNVSTDNAGNWRQCDLEAGDYTVTVLDGIPAWLAPSFDTDGGTNAPDGVTAVQIAGDVSGIDFGYRTNSSIGDTVYVDLDRNGQQGDAEPGIDGVRVKLQNAAGALIHATTTGPGGKYLFPSLSAGRYTVMIDTATVPVNYVNTADEDRTFDSMTSVDLGDNDDHLTADFGYAEDLPQPTSSVGDMVFLDRNANGAFDAGEPGIPGVNIIIQYPGPDGVFDSGGDDVSDSLITDADGMYLETGVPSGPLRITVNGDLANTSTNTADPDGGEPNRSFVTIVGGEDRLDQDFGYAGPNALGDLVWHDADRDGVDDGVATEPRLAGIELTVQWSRTDPFSGQEVLISIGTFTTNADGRYLATNLPDGRYVVTVTGGVPDECSLVSDPQGAVEPDGSSTLTLAGGVADLDQDFGYDCGLVAPSEPLQPVTPIGPVTPTEPAAPIDPAASASIGDLVWIDTNRNGVIDAGEAGVGGVLVTVMSAGPDGVLGTADDSAQQTTTDAAGQYLVGALPGGVTKVTYATAGLPAGHVPIGDLDGGVLNEATVTLAVGEARRDVDFAVIGVGSISGKVYFDNDRNGIKASNESGAPNVTVILRTSGGTEVARVVTDSTGSFRFNAIQSGGHHIEVVRSTLPSGTSFVTETDRNVDGKTSVAVVPGSAADAGIFGIAAARTPGLPNTGSSTTELLLLASASLMIGFLLLQARRRDDEFEPLI